MYDRHVGAYQFVILQPRPLERLVKLDAC